MNILILTSVYPQIDDEKNVGVTPVVKYFAEEWVKSGHNVIIIHNSNKYPKILYLLPSFLHKKVNSRLGIVIPGRRQNKRLDKNLNGVLSIRLPMLKVFPKGGFFDFQINRQFKRIKNILIQIDYKPDIIVGHWENPQIPLLAKLKKEYNSNTTLVFHGLVYIRKKRYRKKIKKYIQSINVFGARSEAIAKEAKELLSLNKKPFICYSGIPDKFFNTQQRINFNKKAYDSYMYVGRLIKRKNVNTTIRVLRELYGNKDFLFNIIGEGPEKEKLRLLVKELNLEESVAFQGYKSRTKVMELLEFTRVFIMISDNETFGLVYIEAMSRGCIVIASKGGGMENIIINGKNGFLCEQGNELELLSICNNIKRMSEEEKSIISNNALETAIKFKDSKIAQSYLENIHK